MKTIKNSFEEHARVMADAATVLPAILDRVAADLHACFARGNKLLACGNGGSASDAEHLVAELVGRYRDERRGLPAITLVSGSATVTALANDYGYEPDLAGVISSGYEGGVTRACRMAAIDPLATLALHWSGQLFGQWAFNLPGHLEPTRLATGTPGDRLMQM